VKLQFKGMRPNAKVSVRYVDDEHGNTLGAWERMGRPRYPTQTQAEELREQSRTVAPQNETLTDGTVTLRLSVNSLAALEVR
ncbi:MAG: glycosyl hydrolase family 39, partial [Candidatus Korobacteraceae bacterium]